MRSATIDWKPAMPLAIFGLMWLAVTLIISTDQQPLVAIVVPYVLLFWYVAWKYPVVAMMLVFSIAPFQNDLSRGGAKFSPTEFNLALLLPVVLLQCYFQHRRFRIGPIFIPVLLYFVTCFYATIHYFLGESTILSIAQMALYLIVVVGIFASYPRSAEQFRPVLYGLLGVCCGIAFYSLATRNNFFWGLTKNGVGQALACGLIVAAELWFASKNVRTKHILMGMMGLIAAGLVFSVSRGAWFSCLASLILICILRQRVQLMLVLALVLMPLVGFTWQFVDPTTQEYATSFDRKRFNIQERYKFIDKARSMWEYSPVYGNGVGLRKKFDATNLMWSTLAETGVVGLAAFLLIHAVFFVMVFRTHKYLARDSIEYSILLIGAALLLRHFCHGMVDHYWSRGAVTMAWGGAGMATYAYFIVRREHRRQAALERQLAGQKLLAHSQRSHTLHVPDTSHRPGLPGLPSPGRS